MKIALIGYGKMGRTVERTAVEQGHEIVVSIDSEADWKNHSQHLYEAEVAIEFTTPHTVFSNVTRCLETGIPVVTGTTGWDDMKPAMKEKCEETGGAVVAASNFSIGVNLFFLINKYAAQLIKPFTSYDVKIAEVHHLQKLDAPSGTAKTIAEDILTIFDCKTSWVNHAVTDKSLLGVESIRKGEVAGDHTVTFFSATDEITLKHSANSRDGFASGAILAASWIIGQKGWFTMNEVMSRMVGFNSEV